MAWVKARTDFEFRGEHYTIGQVFSVEPLVAVLLLAARRVTESKKPVVDATPVEAPTPPSRRGRRTVAKPAVIPDDVPAETATVTAAVEPMSTTSAATLVNPVEPPAEPSA